MFLFSNPFYRAWAFLFISMPENGKPFGVWNLENEKYLLFSFWIGGWKPSRPPEEISFRDRICTERFWFQFCLETSDLVLGLWDFKVNIISLFAIQTIYLWDYCFEAAILRYRDCIIAILAIPFSVILIDIGLPYILLWYSLIYLATVLSHLEAQFILFWNSYLLVTILCWKVALTFQNARVFVKNIHSTVLL